MEEESEEAEESNPLGACFFIISFALAESTNSWILAISEPDGTKVMMRRHSFVQLISVVSSWEADNSVEGGSSSGAS